MEVHAHTHTERKKFTHYLWEFLMLFLAVFCGFLAENFREHQVEKKRAREYIISFYEDLKKDTGTFSRITRDNERKLSVFADLFSCYDTIRKNWRSTSCLIQIAKRSRTNATLVFSTGTLQQLKNAGGYRLLNKEDRDSIQGYDISIEGYKNFESTYYQESQDILRNTFSMIGDFNANKFIARNEAGADSSDVETPLIFSDDKALLNKYFNDLFRYKVAIAGQNRNIDIRKQKADGLLAYFKNKYHFE
jgi:hypothetical protein